MSADFDAIVRAGVSCAEECWFADVDSAIRAGKRELLVKDGHYMEFTISDDGIKIVGDNLALKFPLFYHGGVQIRGKIVIAGNNVHIEKLSATAIDVLGHNAMLYGCQAREVMILGKNARLYAGWYTKVTVVVNPIVMVSARVEEIHGPVAVNA